MNRVAIITGGSGGIGKELVKTFSENDYEILFTYYKNFDEAVKISKSLPFKNSYIKLDLINPNSVDYMFNYALKEFGHIDILVNNAGNFENNFLGEMSDSEWFNVLNVNLTGVFYCTRKVISHMIENNFGRVINITSVQGQIGTIGGSNYAAAKAGVIGFTKSIAKEVAKKNICVNAVSLGFINTGMLLKLPEKLRKRILQNIPMDRFGEPKEVADLVLFLASEKVSYITGQVININGGYYL